MKMMQNKNGQRGFTLIELLIAITILAVGLLSLASMQATAINSNSIANRHSVETALAQEVMEQIVSRDIYDPLVNTAAANQPYAGLDPDNPTALSFAVPGTAATFNARYSITLDTPVKNVTQIIVTVTGGGRTATFMSYKRVI
jgi:type IV pilus assembly protein PilV